MGDNDLNILKESIKEVLNELGNNNSFRIEDYWNLEKLSPEQIQSLNTDLSVYLYGKNFGSPLYYENGKPVL